MKTSASTVREDRGAKLMVGISSQPVDNFTVLGGITGKKHGIECSLEPCYPRKQGSSCNICSMTAEI